MSVEGVFRVLQPPATRDEIAALQSACGVLPASYLDFLAETNGSERGVHDADGDCLTLWASNEIAALNDAYQIARWVAEFLVIGSDGGDSAIGFDRAESMNPELWPVVRVGFGNLDRAEFVRLADGFRDWQDREFRLRRSARVS